MNKTESTFDDWKEYGNEVKELRDKLIKLSCNKKYQNLLKDKGINNHLIMSLKQIDKFCDKAEEKMLLKTNPPVEEEKWMNVFYGTKEGSKLVN